MLSYCLKSKNNTERINPRVSKTNSGTPLNKIPVLGDMFF